jgi:glucoamylase
MDSAASGGWRAMMTAAGSDGEPVPGVGQARIRSLAKVGLVVAVAAGCLVAVAARGSAGPQLLSAGAAQDPCVPSKVTAVPAGAGGTFAPTASVLRTAEGVYLAPGRTSRLTPALAVCVGADAAAGERWLSAGIVPGSGPLMKSMATRALLDLRLSLQPDGAVVAGWRPRWAYVWPRDSSWVAVALADTGHPGDAFRILRFLGRMQRPDGTWAARYWPNGSGPVRDGRPSELDATGWVPWAVWSWLAAAQHGDTAERMAVRRQLAVLWPMVQAAADAAARSLTADGLPRPSMDYWEDSVQVTLGTCAPLLSGLRAAADIAAGQGARELARRWALAAQRLSSAMRSAFGRYGYHRLPYQRSGSDAAAAFLGPPFAPASPLIGRAVLASQRALTLPGGGVTPGTDWPGNRATAWTAETAAFALYDAESGDHQTAAQILTWLARHRTRLGELPERIAGGQPASVAPLAWTDAAVLLALIAQAHYIPAVPVPSPSGRPATGSSVAAAALPGRPAGALRR